MTDEHAHGERETDDIADEQQAPTNKPPWAELRPLDIACLGVFAGIALCIVVLILRA